MFITNTEKEIISNAITNVAKLNNNSIKRIEALEKYKDCIEKNCDEVKELKLEIAKIKDIHNVESNVLPEKITKLEEKFEKLSEVASFDFKLMLDKFKKYDEKYIEIFEKITKLEKDFKSLTEMFDYNTKRTSQILKDNDNKQDNTTALISTICNMLKLDVPVIVKEASILRSDFAKFLVDKLKEISKEETTEEETPTEPAKKVKILSKDFEYIKISDLANLNKLDYREVKYAFRCLKKHSPELIKDNTIRLNDKKVYLINNHLQRLILNEVEAKYAN